MKTSAFTTVLLAGAALAGAAFAQPSGGPDAKGNAPLKPGHTVNDGAAKHGANSFTEGQARTHIEKAGFTGVTGLMKGPDGVWRGQAMRGGGSMDVAMDFKGNVTTTGGGQPPPSRMMGRPRGPGPGPAPDPAMGPTPMTDMSTSSTQSMTTSDTMAAHRHARRRHHRHHRRAARCASAMRAGAACSGVDRDANGVSDKEDRMLRH